jgi:hypothetical protein
MHLLEPSVLIAAFFSVAGLITVLAAAVVMADKLASAWHYGESTTRGGKPRGRRCASVGSRPKRSRDCPIIGRRKHW